MKQYLAFLKFRITTGLQYRVAAISGMATQIFFGLVYTMIYLAFYESGTPNSSMTLSQLITYLWLNQTFFSITFMHYKDKEIISMIEDGTIAYELCRPQNLYLKWYIKILAGKVSGFLLRSVPILIFAFVIPSPLKMSLPNSWMAFILFIISMFFGTFLISAISTLAHLACCYTINSRGTFIFIYTIIEFLSGSMIPLPLLPNVIEKIANVLPFRYMSDLPFRIYSGNIPINEAYFHIFLQIFWLIVSIIAGFLIVNKVEKRIEVQGG